MTRSRILSAVTLAGAACAFACKAAPQPFAEETVVSAVPVRPAFNPPQDVAITERSSQVRVERRAGGPPATEAVEARLQSTFVREKAGWRLTQRVPSIRLLQNGAELHSELAQLVTKFPITVQLASDGSFVQLLNASEIEEALRSAFEDPRQVEVVLAAFTPEAVERQSRAEWMNKYGDLLGRDLVPGMAFYGVETVGTSRGEITFVVERRVTGTRLGEHGRELVLSLSCPVESAQTADPIAAQRALDDRGNPELEKSVKCHGEQVVGLDPFVPRATTLEVKAVATPSGEEPLEVVFTRKVRTDPLRPSSPNP